MWKKTIAVTGWWSGGHITPLVSLLNYVHTSKEFASKCNDIYWFGEKNSLEEDACDALPWVNFVPIPAGKRRRYRNIEAVAKNIRDMGRLLAGIGVAGRKLRSLDIDVVFGKWGHVSLPVCLAAWILRKKIIIHESDLHPWLANRLLYPFASLVFTWFEQKSHKSRLIGQILSLQLVEPPSADFDLSHIDATKTIVLVLGGSQWAKALFDGLKEILDTRWHVAKEMVFIVTLGSKNAQYKEIFMSYENVHTVEYVGTREMWVLYRLGDVAITRGWITSLAEQKLFAIRSCIVPTPYTWGNHQRRNAQWYEKLYGDTCVKQNHAMVAGIVDFLEAHLSYKKAMPPISTEHLESSYKEILASWFES